MFVWLLWDPWIGSMKQKNGIYATHCHAARISLEVLWRIPECWPCPCSSLPNRTVTSVRGKGKHRWPCPFPCILGLDSLWTLLCYFAKGVKWEQLEESSFLPLFDLIWLDGQLSSSTQCLTHSSGEFGDCAQDPSCIRVLQKKKKKEMCVYIYNIYV